MKRAFAPALLAACLAFFALCCAALAACTSDAGGEPAGQQAQQQEVRSLPAAAAADAAEDQPEQAGEPRTPATDLLEVILDEAAALERNGFWESAAGMRDRVLADPAFPVLSPQRRYDAQLDQVKLWLALDRGGDATALLSELAWDLAVMPPESARRHALLRARAFRDAGDLATAVSSLDRYVADSGPALATVLVIRAGWQLELGQYEASDASAQQALAYAALPDGERREALLISAEALERLERNAAAIDRLVDLLAGGPPLNDRAAALARIGELEAANGNLSGSITAWLQLVEDLPASAPAADALDRLRELDAGIPRIAAGRVLYAADRLDEARAELIDAIVFGTAAEQAEAEFLIARIAQARGELDAAFSGYLAVPGRDSDSPFAAEAVWRAADLYSEEGSSAAAEPLYERVMRDHPDYIWAADAALRWALWRADEIGWEAVLARLVEGESLQSGWTVNERQRHLLWQGIASARLDRPADAQALWQRAAELAPGSYYGARAALHLGEPADAFSVRADAEAWLRLIAGPEPAGSPPPAESTRWRAALDLREAGFDARAVAQFTQWRIDAGSNLWTLYRMALHLEAEDEISAALIAAEQLLSVSATPWWQAPAAIARLGFPRPWAELRSTAAAERGVDPDLFAALIRWESRFDPNARGLAGEIGLTQVIPGTSALIAEVLGEEHDHARLARPETAIRYGAWFLGSQLADYDDRAAVALAAYNAGPGSARRWLDTAAGYDDRAGGEAAAASFAPDPFADDAFEAAIDFPTTRAYVRKILEGRAAYTALAAHEAAHTPAGG